MTKVNSLKWIYIYFFIWEANRNMLIWSKTLDYANI